MYTGNPLTSWMGFTDPNGVNLADYHLLFSKPGFTDFLQPIFIFFAELLMYLLNVVVLTVLWAVQSLVGDGFILNFIVVVTDTVLKAIHSVMPPYLLAALAFGVLTVRALLPDNSVFNGPIGQTMQRTLGRTSTSSSWGVNAINPHKLMIAIRQGVFVFVAIMIFSANPLKIVQRMAQFAASFAADGNNGEVTWATDLVQTLYSMANFQVVVGDSCQGVWAEELSQTYGEATAACVGLPPVEAGLSHVFMSIFSVFVYACIIFYLGAVLYRGVFLFGYAVWDVVTLPYVLAIQMFKPDAGATDRYTYDKAFEILARAVVYLAYYVFAVFLLTSGPSIVLTAAGKVDAHWIFIYVLMALSFLAAAFIALHILTPRLNDGRPMSIFAVADKLGAVTVRDENGERKIQWKATARNVASKLTQTTVVQSTLRVADNVSTTFGGPVISARRELAEDQMKLLRTIEQDTGVRDQTAFARAAITNIERAEKKLQSEKTLLALKRRMRVLTPEQLRAEEQRLVDKQLLIDAVKKHTEKRNFQASLVPVPAEYSYMFAGKTHISTEELRAADLAHLDREVRAVTGVGVKSLAEFNTVGARYATLQNEIVELSARALEAQEVGDFSRAEHFKEQIALREKDLEEIEPLKKAKEQFIRRRNKSWFAPKRMHFDDLEKNLDVWEYQPSEEEQLRARSREEVRIKYGIDDEETFEDFQHRHARLATVEQDLEDVHTEQALLKRDYHLGVISQGQYKADNTALEAQKKTLLARRETLKKLVALGDNVPPVACESENTIEIADVRYTDGTKLRMPEHKVKGKIVMPTDADVAQWIVKSEQKIAAEEVSRTFAPMTSALRYAQRQLSHDSDSFISTFDQHSQEFFSSATQVAQTAYSFTRNPEFEQRIEQNKQRLFDLQQAYLEAEAIPYAVQREQAKSEIAEKFTRAFGSVQHTALSAAQAAGEAHVAARGTQTMDEVLQGFARQGKDLSEIEPQVFDFADPSTWNPTFTPSPGETDEKKDRLTRARVRKAQQAVRAAQDATPQDTVVTATGRTIEREESTVTPVTGPVGENVLQAGSLIQYAEANGVEAIAGDNALDKTVTGHLSSEAALRVDDSAVETQAGFTVKYDMKRAQSLSDAAGQSSLTASTDNTSALPTVTEAKVVEVQDGIARVKKHFD